MTKDEYDAMHLKSILKEHKHWSLLMHIKYMTGPNKFLFEDEASARTTYEDFSVALKNYKDYRNDREHTFTFTALGNSSTTVDIGDVSYISVNPPVSDFYESDDYEQC